MAYDDGLAQRVRDVITGEIDFVEKRMFGGVGMLLNGNMVCGVLNNDLIVRVGPDRHDEAMARDGARPFDITGRAMNGWVMIGDDALDDDDAFEWWVNAGIAHTRSLPAKDPTQKRATGKPRAPKTKAANPSPTKSATKPPSTTKRAARKATKATTAKTTASGDAKKTATKAKSNTATDKPKAKRNTARPSAKTTAKPKARAPKRAR